MTHRAAAEKAKTFSASTVRVLRQADRAISAAPRGDHFRLYAAARVAMDCLAPVDSFYVALIRPRDRTTAFPYTFDHGQALATEVLPYGPQGLTAWMLASRRTYRYADDDGSLINRGHAFGEDETSKDAIVSPLSDPGTEDAPYGFMSVLSSQPRVFTAEHVRALEWLATAVCLARSSERDHAGVLRLAELYPELGGHHVDTADDLVNYIARALHDLHDELGMLEQRLRGDPDAGETARRLAKRCLTLQAKVNEIAELPEAEDPLKKLTTRELEVGRLLGSDEALTNRQIANRLGVSEATVKTHVSAVLRKLNVRQRSEVRWVLLSRPTRVP